jgi:hypothetical protein
VFLIMACLRNRRHLAPLALPTRILSVATTDASVGEALPQRP